MKGEKEKKEEREREERKEKKREKKAARPVCFRILELRKREKKFKQKKCGAYKFQTEKRFSAEFFFHLLFMLRNMNPRCHVVKLFPKLEMI